MALNHLDPNTATKLNDLRRRILENEQAGRPAHYGITKDEVAAALGHLRQNRMSAAEAKAKKKTKASTKAAAAKIDLQSLFK